jgi:3-keto-disaccharide hydrolase
MRRTRINSCSANTGGDGLPLWRSLDSAEQVMCETTAGEREPSMSRRLQLAFSLGAALLALHPAHPQTKWAPHDLNRPQPPVVDPGTPSTPDVPGRAPADAIVLFGGKDLAAWSQKDGSPAAWKVTPDYFEVVPKSGYIYTRQAFGDCQLHIEFSEPSPARGEGQDRGNSGVIFMGLYEIQVLDSFENKTYADGQAAAVYGQYPPLVNASRPPGQWQSYDIIFHGPRFADGKLIRAGRFTVLHNGVLVQDNVEIHGPTASDKPDEPHAEKLPLALQDHNHPVRYRNIWIRPLND